MSKTTIFLKDSPCRETLPLVVAATYFSIVLHDYSIQTHTFMLAAIITGQRILKSFTVLEKSPETLGSN